MKTRIRSIFWLMTVCILGINLFQAYWLYTTYQLHYQQFSRAVKEAMFEALQKQQLSEAQRFIGQKHIKQDPRAQFFYRQFNSESPELGQIMIEERHDRISSRSQKPDSQTISHRSKVTSLRLTIPDSQLINQPIKTARVSAFRMLSDGQAITILSDTNKAALIQLHVTGRQSIKGQIDSSKIAILRLQIPLNHSLKDQPDTSKTAIYQPLSSESQPRSELRSKVRINVKRTYPYKVAADSIARHLSDLLVFRWSEEQTFDLKKMASIYKDELKRREVEAGFVLDTLNFPVGKRAVRIVNVLPQPKAGYAIQTTPVPINPVKGKFLQASFKTPTSYILRRMGWILGSSILLLALTTGCFLFMLSTILRQKKLSEIKNDFINNMTHELKTPIATVSAAVEAMQYFGALNDPKKTETYLTISRNELQRLSDLVEKVLNMAVEEQRELTLHPQPTNPAELVQELVQRHQLKAVKPVAFQVDVATDPVVIDQVHVGNVINNLIDNAIKYSKEQVLIQINAGYQADNWCLSVADDGIGIPKGYQEAIFDRFFRVPTGNLHPVKGFGLGLYYVRQVVERHRGTIEVRSEASTGSEFIITLPQLKMYDV